MWMNYAAGSCGYGMYLKMKADLYWSNDTNTRLRITKVFNRFDGKKEEVHTSNELI